MVFLSPRQLDFNWFKMLQPNFKNRCKYDHAASIWRPLHWLPVQFRINFKILLFVYKCLHNLTPNYPSDILCPYNPPRSLRYGNLNLLTVNCTRLTHRGDRAFLVAGPRLWNSLPVQLRAASSLSVFKSLLKTHLFSLAFNIC